MGNSVFSRVKPLMKRPNIMKIGIKNSSLATLLERGSHTGITQTFMSQIHYGLKDTDDTCIAQEEIYDDAKPPHAKKSYTRSCFMRRICLFQSTWNSSDLYKRLTNPRDVLTHPVREPVNWKKLVFICPIWFLCAGDIVVSSLVSTKLRLHSFFELNLPYVSIFCSVFQLRWRGGLTSCPARCSSCRSWGHTSSKSCYPCFSSHLWGFSDCSLVMPRWQLGQTFADTSRTAALFGITAANMWRGKYISWCIARWSIDKRRPEIRCSS